MTLRLLAILQFEKCLQVSSRLALFCILCLFLKSLNFKHELHSPPLACSSSNCHLCSFDFTFHEFVLFFFFFFSRTRLLFLFFLIVMLLCCLFRADSSSSLQNPLLVAFSSDSISHPHVASESDTAANTEAPSTQSIEEQATENAASTQHESLYTIIDGPWNEGKQFVFMIKWFFDRDHLEAAISHYGIGAFTDLTGTNGRELARAEEWSVARWLFLSFSFSLCILPAFCIVFLCSFCSFHFLSPPAFVFCRDNAWGINGNQLHDCNCWDTYGSGCYVWLTTGDNPSGGGARLSDQTDVYVLYPWADLPVLMKSGSQLKQSWYTDLDKPSASSPQEKTATLSNPSSSLLSLNYGGSDEPAFLTTAQCNAITAAGGHIPYYDMHPIAGCWTDLPSSSAELMRRLGSFWNDSVLWVQPKSNDVIFSYCGLSYFQHFQAEFGTDMSMTECGEDTGLVHSRLAFGRGSGRQYLTAWGLGNSPDIFSDPPVFCALFSLSLLSFSFLLTFSFSPFVLSSSLFSSSLPPSVMIHGPLLFRFSLVVLSLCCTDVSNWYYDYIRSYGKRAPWCSSFVSPSSCLLCFSLSLPLKRWCREQLWAFYQLPSSILLHGVLCRSPGIG